MKVKVIAGNMFVRNQATGTVTEEGTDMLKVKFNKSAFKLLPQSGLEVWLFRYLLEEVK